MYCKGGSLVRISTNHLNLMFLFIIFEFVIFKFIFSIGSLIAYGFYLISEYLENIKFQYAK